MRRKVRGKKGIIQLPAAVTFVSGCHKEAGVFYGKCPGQPVPGKWPGMAAAAGLAVILAMGLAGCSVRVNDAPVHMILENPGDGAAREPEGAGAAGAGNTGDAQENVTNNQQEQAGEDGSRREPGGPADKSGDGAGGSGSQPEGSAAASLEGVLSQIGWEAGQKNDLAGIQKLLDDNGIHYAGYINQTQERLDLELGEDTRMVFLSVSGDMGQNMRYELVLSWDGAFDKSTFQEGYLHQYDVTAAEAFCPGTDERLMDEWELYDQCGSNLTSLQIARNELYARHGRIFKDPFLQEIFSTRSWYEPRFTAAEYEQKAEPFSRIEKQNLESILQLENQIKGIDPGESLREGRMLLSGSWLDLDGDGGEEQIRYGIRTDPANDTGSYRLEVNGQAKSGEGINLYPYVKVAEAGSGRKILIAASNGPSDDPWNDCFVYENQGLASIGSMAGNFQGTDASGMLYVSVQWDFFQTCILPFTYRIDIGEKQLARQDKDFYEYGNEASVKQKILLYKDQSFREPAAEVAAGEQVLIEGSDLKNGVRIRRLSTGETGWLKCREPYYCVMPDGQELESWNVFEELPFFG